MTSSSEDTFIIPTMGPKVSSIITSIAKILAWSAHIKIRKEGDRCTVIDVNKNLRRSGNERTPWPQGTIPLE
ncbi:aldehyde dehydrogenase [Moniliophthora roreri]|nr:aldehyde dehydrogenase [Moniliophthora roreri]